LEVHDTALADPLTLHDIMPVGATDPVVPTTEAVKTKVELIAPVPDPMSPTVGDVLAIFIVIGAEAPRAV
jgi:hypothetical protein